MIESRLYENFSSDAKRRLSSLTETYSHGLELNKYNFLRESLGDNPIFHVILLDDDIYSHSCWLFILSRAFFD